MKTSGDVVENTRRSDRVQLAVAIEVSGIDLNGQSFTEQTQTVAITRHGAALVLRRKLAPGRELTIRRTHAGKEAAFRVVREMGKQADGYLYGVACQDQNANICDIEFPPLTESVKAVGRILLQCSGCQTREVAYLDEFEMESFEASRSVTRACKRCAAPTQWQPVPPGTPTPSVSHGVKPEAAAGVPAAPGVKNRRKEPRTKMKLNACIRQRGSDENVVSTENVSRSGLCFRSEKHYPEGTLIEVAVPYTQGGANIFVPARIVYSEELKPGKAFRQGVEYLKVRRTG